MSDIYTPPKSNLILDKNKIEGKRPGWVWVISLFYIFSFVVTFLIFSLIFSGVIPLPENQKHYFENLGIMGQMIMLVSSILSLAAAITLFRLKKLTVKLWLAKLLLDIVSIVYNIVTTNWLQTTGSSGIVGMFVGLAIVISIYLYTKRLDARGFLK